MFISDRGPGFRSELVEALMEKLGIQHRYSSPYYPQCNGLVEKTNGQIMKMLSKYVKDNPIDWEQNLAKCLWAYRTSYKISTHFTPFELTCGKAVIVPIQVQLDALKIISRYHNKTNDPLEERIHKLELLQMDRDKACDFYMEEAEKRIAKVNAKLPMKDIKVGDLVMKYDSRLDSTFQTKFRNKWIGPYKVMKIFPNGTYQLSKLSGEPLGYRIKRMKKYFPRAILHEVHALLVEHECST